MAESGLNAGVHATSGFEMQKHCALYLILENFNIIHDREYFVSIEHADDVIFCFLHRNEIEYIDAYQVKKSSKIGTNNKAWREIVEKLLTTGKELSSKDIAKSAEYYHKLSFLSNQTSTIKAEVTDKVTEEKKEFGIQVNESNVFVKFDKFPIELQTDIISKLTIKDKRMVEELRSLCFEYIDLSRTVKNQKECLVGKCASIFGKNVPDPEAAIDTLMKVFRKVEHTFNQGSTFDLLDESKRVYSVEINAAFRVITEKALAFETWRNLKSELSEALKIPISRRDDFENEFDNSVDCFKDLTQVEHQRILKFVEINSHFLDEYFREEECVAALYSMYKDNNSYKLDELVIKATIFAACMRVRDQKCRTN